MTGFYKKHWQEVHGIKIINVIHKITISQNVPKFVTDLHRPNSSDSQIGLRVPLGGEVGGVEPLLGECK